MSVVTNCFVYGIVFQLCHDKSSKINKQNGCQFSHKQHR
nr:MAG TPA: hypothetical protein [Caudoviricetes sp.]